MTISEEALPIPWLGQCVLKLPFLGKVTSYPGSAFSGGRCVSMGTCRKGY